MASPNNPSTTSASSSLSVMDKIKQLEANKNKTPPNNSSNSSNSGSGGNKPSSILEKIEALEKSKNNSGAKTTVSTNTTTTKTPSPSNTNNNNSKDGSGSNEKRLSILEKIEALEKNKTSPATTTTTTAKTTTPTGGSTIVEILQKKPSDTTANTSSNTIKSTPSPITAVPNNKPTTPTSVSSTPSNNKSTPSKSIPSNNNNNTNVTSPQSTSILDKVEMLTTKRTEISSRASSELGEKLALRRLKNGDSVEDSLGWWLTTNPQDETKHQGPFSLADLRRRQDIDEQVWLQHDMYVPDWTRIQDVPETLDHINTTPTSMSTIATSSTLAATATAATGGDSIEEEPIWFYSSGNDSTTHIGPVAVSEIRTLIRTGAVERDSLLVWKDGMEEWKPVKEVDELKNEGKTLEEKIQERRAIVDQQGTITESHPVTSTTDSGWNMAGKSPSSQSTGTTTATTTPTKKLQENNIGKLQKPLPTTPSSTNNTNSNNSNKRSTNTTTTTISGSKSTTFTIKRRSHRYRTIFFCWLVPLSIMSAIWLFFATLHYRRFYLTLASLPFMDLEPCASSGYDKCLVQKNDGTSKIPPSWTVPSHWSPSGIRSHPSSPPWLVTGSSAAMVVDQQPTIIPLMKTSRHSEDASIITAVAPRVEFTLNMLPDTTIFHGPVFDDGGLLFVSPTSNNEEIRSTAGYISSTETLEIITLIAIDSTTGEKKWSHRVLAESLFVVDAISDPTTPPKSIPARFGGSTNLILNDPDAPPTLDVRNPQIIYHATRSSVFALRSHDGAVVWSTPLFLPQPTFLDFVIAGGDAQQPPPAIFSTSMTLTYMPKPLDAIVGISNDGHIWAVDRRSGVRLVESKRLPCGRKNSYQCLVHLEIASSPLIIGRFFIVGLARDDLDGTTDDFSEAISLYMVEIIRGEADSHLPFRVRIAASVMLSATSSLQVTSPKISPDGRFVVLIDALDGLKGFDALYFDHSNSGGGGGGGVPKFVIDVNEGNVVVNEEQVAAGGAIVGSIAVAGDEGLAIYVSTPSGTILKYICDYFSELRSSGNNGNDWSWPEGKLPDLKWKIRLHFPSASYDAAVLPRGSLLLSANALVMAFGVITTNWPYSTMSGYELRSGVALLDLETGNVRSYAFDEASVNGVAIGLDGSIFATHSFPELREKSIQVFGSSTGVGCGSDSSCPRGGISKFKVVDFLELARDAACAAAARAENTLTKASGGWLQSPPPGGEEAARLDAKNVGALLWQGLVAFQVGIEKGELSRVGQDWAANMAKGLAQAKELSESVVKESVTSTQAFSVLQAVKGPARLACEVGSKPIFVVVSQ
jgi:hypothetical protein